MQLSERQEQTVVDYLRAVTRLAGDGIAAGDRERGLARLESRIREELQRLRRAQPDDAEVEGVLQRMGTPAVQAALLAAPEPSEATIGQHGDRVWLGVCGWIAGMIDMPPRLVRVGAVCLGVTGPLALLGYLGAYAAMRMGTPKEKREPIDWLGVVWRVGVVFALLIALRTGFGYLLRGLEIAYSEGMERGLPEMGDWGALRYRAGTYYGYALFCCVPLAALSALPLHGGWGKSLYRFAQALVTLYAIALCYGTAEFLVGIILDFVKQFSGNVELPWQNLLQR